MIDKKLHDILDYLAESYRPEHEYNADTTGHNETLRNEAVAEIRQCFLEEGWQPVATPVLSSEDNVNNYYFDRTDKSWKVVPDKLMAGKEWLDRFTKECEKLGDKPIRAKYVIEAARRASGIKE